MKKISIITVVAITIISTISFVQNSNGTSPRVIIENKAEVGMPPALLLQPDDIFIGEENAPVQIVEYASMTCGHCANFHKNQFKKIKANYINTGKVRFVMRDLPWDNLAFAVAKIARCTPEKQFYTFVDVFFTNQERWLRSKNPVGEIKKLARLGGMSSKMVDECIENKSLHEKINATRKTATEVLNVPGTPAIFINGKMIKNTSYSSISSKIDEILAQ